jgi:hypothetical protein
MPDPRQIRDILQQLKLEIDGVRLSSFAQHSKARRKKLPQDQARAAGTSNNNNNDPPIQQHTQRPFDPDPPMGTIVQIIDGENCLHKRVRSHGSVLVDRSEGVEEANEQVEGKSGSTVVGAQL